MKNKPFELKLGDPDLNNFRKDLSEMKKKSHTFREDRRKAHEITEKDLTLYFNI